MSTKPHKWTEPEIEFLSRNCHKLNTRELAKHLNITYDQARSMIRKLKLDRKTSDIRRLQRLGGHQSKRSKTVSKQKIK